MLAYDAAMLGGGWPADDNPRLMEGVAFVRWCLSLVSYPGYSFRAKEVGGRFYIQGVFDAMCAKTGEVEPQYTRKWYIGKDATRSEIVQTALKCVLTSVEHEARERFTYRNRAIFAPHYDVDTLHRVCGEQEVR